LGRFLSGGCIVGFGGGCGGLGCLFLGFCGLGGLVLFCGGGGVVFWVWGGGGGCGLYYMVAGELGGGCLFVGRWLGGGGGLGGGAVSLDHGHFYERGGRLGKSKGKSSLQSLGRPSTKTGAGSQKKVGKTRDLFTIKRRRREKNRKEKRATPEKQKTKGRHVQNK